MFGDVALPLMFEAAWKWERDKKREREIDLGLAGTGLTEVKHFWKVLTLFDVYFFSIMSFVERRHKHVM
jgi:hypothetical protein